jgi:serine/threonine protein kinase/Tfp pilus assembly protein PilF
MTEHTAPTEELVGRVADEFTQRLNRGERPDPEEYARRHPRIAALLREVLPALQLIRLPPGGAAAEPDGLAGTLGDFRIVREVGRGGMGVVYEAQQISLGRRVALKVLPFAATLDARQLQRFKNEAQAAALLHHPNIVPVYAVGCERGVHYYAMQFIDGQSLAEVIADLRAAGAGAPAPAADARTPDPAPSTRPSALLTERSARGGEYFRAVARLGVQAALALEHAHQLGVVHRDVKPGNLLLDAEGRLWVTDFGLARCQAGPGVTVSGDLVGTLRYMSPEQALGRRGVVDQRSDVYSLGATLYEALTREPAYPGGDRAELLRQIARGEPRPPRRVSPSVPAGLETVVLKAMAQEPDRRYATAQELADDLGRFLEHRPVRAKRATALERAAKWARRHRPAVTAAAALATACLLITTAAVWVEKGRTEAALGEARGQSERALRGEAEARAQRRRAEANFEKALTGATRILTHLDPRPGAPPPEGPALHRALEDEGLRFFRQFIDEGSPDPAVRFESGRAYALMATVYCARGEAPQSQAMMRKAFALLEGLVAAYPAEAAYRKELLKAHYLMGLLHTSLKQPAEAREEYARTAELHRLALAHDPDAGELNHFAWFLVDCPDPALRDPAEAVALARRAVGLAPEAAAYWNTLGVAHYRAGAWADAAAALERSVALGAGGDPSDWFFLAMAAWHLGDRPRAERWYGKAARTLGQTVALPEYWLRYRAEAEALMGPPPKAPE